MKRLVLSGVLVGAMTFGGFAVPAQAATTITVTQHSHVTAWKGRAYHWVAFPGRGRIAGTVKGVRAGTPVVLRASVFPFTHGYARIARTKTGRAGGYGFTVHPTVATRYRVVAAGTTSHTVTFYVLNGFRILSATYCQLGATTCHADVSLYNFYPATVGSRETRLKHYLYVGVTRGSSVLPRRLYRHSFTRTYQRVSATKWLENLRFTFYAGPSLWRVQWELCTREIEGTDGFDLPVHTGCGSSSLPTQRTLSTPIG